MRRICRLERTSLSLVVNHMKTVRDHLSSLPTGYRELALANMGEAVANSLEERPSVALAWAFIWNSTPQGNAFWGAVANSLIFGTELPPLPNPRLTALLSEHASLLALLSENVTKANCETLRAINRELARLVDMQPVQEKTMEVEPL